jgi:hypothetical protein
MHLIDPAGNLPNSGRFAAAGKRTLSGLPRLIRYESWEIGWVMPSVSMVSVKSRTSSSVSGLARHWLLFLVKICTQSQPSAAAISTAL